MVLYLIYKYYACFDLNEIRTKKYFVFIMINFYKLYRYMFFLLWSPKNICVSRHFYLLKSQNQRIQDVFIGCLDGGQFTQVLFSTIKFVHFGKFLKFILKDLSV